jgi:predicted dehydrogenase
VTPAVESPRNVYKHSYAREIEHFVNCVAEKEKPISPAADGLAIMRIIDAIYASAKSGKEVSLA